MERINSANELDEATKVETAEALTKSRQFLTTRLLPDLDRANGEHQSLVAQIDEYKKLRDALRLFDNNATSKVKVGDRVLADVGSGVAVETKL